MADNKEESKPVSQPEETKPEESKPTESKPVSQPEETKPEETKPEEAKPEEAKPSGKAEKKVRKALSKLGMVKVDGVNRVTMKQKDSYVLFVKDPEVYSSPQNPNSFIIFGEVTFDDHEKKLTQEAIAKLKKEGEKLNEKKEEPKVEVVPEGEELSEEGLEKDAIETVMNEGKCSRQAAIKALRAHNGDPVEALLDVGQ